MAQAFSDGSVSFSVCPLLGVITGYTTLYLVPARLRDQPNVVSRRRRFTMPARMPSTYAFEPTPEWISVNPKPLLPFRTRGEDLPKPPLPSPPRDEFFNDNYTVSTHLIPAACPRLTPDVPLPPAPEFSTDPSERKRNIQQTAAQIRELQALYDQGKFGEERSEKLLWNCVNRYARRRVRSYGKSGLTLLLTHANGFPKEVLVYSIHRSFFETRFK